MLYVPGECKEFGYRPNDWSLCSATCDIGSRTRTIEYTLANITRLAYTQSSFFHKEAVVVYALLIYLFAFAADVYNFLLQSLLTLNDAKNLGATTAFFWISCMLDG